MDNKRHLKKFENQTTYESQKNTLMKSPYVVYLEDTQEVVYVNKTYEFVDLGLPSGTLWATKNIGADSEEDFGLYFAWGSVEGATKEGFESGEYTFGTDGNMVNHVDPSTETWTKYNKTDGKLVLDLEDDAAYVHMGEDWHMPTKEQCSELITFTNQVRESVNGVNGVRFTSKSNNNASIFIPCAGTANFDGQMAAVNSGFNVLSNTVYEMADVSVHALCSNANNLVNIGFTARHDGHSVRGVKG